MLVTTADDALVGVHAEAARRLSSLDQRYTASRRALVEAIADAGRPVTIPELLHAVDGVPQSSAYRNLTVLAEAGVVRRLPGLGSEDHGRFELAEALAGHHHHLICTSCGAVADVHAGPAVERALAEAAAAAATATGYLVTGHAIDLEGVCADCQVAGSRPAP